MKYTSNIYVELAILQEENYKLLVEMDKLRNIYKLTEQAFEVYKNANVRLERRIKTLNKQIHKLNDQINKPTMTMVDYILNNQK